MKEKTGNLAGKERPMLFSGAMVRALLDGSKTQTRRIMKPQPVPIPGEPGKHWWPSNAAQSMMRVEDGFQKHPGIFDDACPHGQPGDRIYVRETFQGPLFAAEQLEEFRRDSTKFEAPEFCVYAADGGGAPEFQDADENLVCRWRPSIHMPRWASRILLEIVAVRVERLNACSDADAVAEGIGLNPSVIGMKLTNPPGESMAIAMYRALWDSINGAGSWAANPWVWVVEFKRVTP